MHGEVAKQVGLEEVEFGWNPSGMLETKHLKKMQFGSDSEEEKARVRAWMKWWSSMTKKGYEII